MRYTTAYNEFSHRLVEVQCLNQIAAEELSSLERFDAIPVVHSLCEANVVFLSGHLEAYMRKLAESILARIYAKQLPKDKLTLEFRYYFSRDLIDQIRDTRDPGSVAKKLRNIFDRDIHIWNDDSSFRKELSSKRFLSNLGNPKYESIKSFMARFGYDQYQGDLRESMRQEYSICIAALNNIVETRNRIAHGDRTNRTMAWMPQEVEKKTDLLKRFVRETDIAVANWFKRKGCTIRCSE